ncbi:Hypothetical Protein FCC1311_067582 [Hondaea fermentalgiana]|uniref:Uncharacterized protein n=1 Tax=Hondaea fermentalgiana TaxID=2315210 RepID=A0A2R5GLC1_9STRA|nr:Hypothetical Protein FCC1311_067582 [Hondaea fermentalgiana]|eukprot:GBG30538.1 Hypothetical Protein FCC1311_067582 [Hondaea fermentalgiana]
MGNLPLFVMNASVFGSSVLAYLAPGWTALKVGDTTFGHGVYYGYSKYSGDDYDEVPYTYIQTAGVPLDDDGNVVTVKDAQWVGMPILGAVIIALALVQMCFSCSSGKGLSIVKFTNVMMILLAVAIMVVYVYTDFWIRVGDACDNGTYYSCDEGMITWTFSNLVGGEVVIYKFWWSYFFGCVLIFFCLLSFCLAAQYQKA